MAEQVIADFGKNPGGLVVTETIIVKNLKMLDFYLKKLRQIKQIDCVIVGSGDGTIVSVLNALKDQKDIVYGFLPLGTSNTFVRSLGIPVTYAKSKKIILDRHTSSVTLGSVNGHLFANIAGLGVPVRVTKNLSNKVKRIFGPFAYVISGVRETIDHRAFYFQITNDHIHESFFSHHVLIANGKYHGHLPVSHDASLFKNQLVLVAFGTSQSRSGYVRSMLRFMLRRHEQDPNVQIIPFERAYITAHPKRGIEADGEMISQTPATVEVVKDAITVFTPKATKRKSKANK